jgi:dTDP-4-dehydrorhamnose reductase
VINETRVLILGGAGMLGHKLAQVLGPKYRVFATFRDQQSMCVGRNVIRLLDADRLIAGVDAVNFASVSKAVEVAAPDVVINCIGIVKQSAAMQEGLAMQVNAEFPHRLAQLCAEHDSRLLHFSTDCVFSGARGNYVESDSPDPVDLYGRSKLQGEVTRGGCLTLRTSIIGWELEHQRSLLGWFATQRGRTIKGYRRAIFSGLPTSQLAALVADVVIPEPALTGLFHVSAAPINKLDLLVGLRNALGWHDIDIEPDDKVVCDRSLSAARFREVTGWVAPPWSEMITDLAREK